MLEPIYVDLVADLVGTITEFGHAMSVAQEGPGSNQSYFNRFRTGLEKSEAISLFIERRVHQIWSHCVSPPLLAPEKYVAPLVMLIMIMATMVMIAMTLTTMVMVPRASCTNVLTILPH